MILKGLADNSSSTKGSVQLRSKWYGPYKKTLKKITDYLDIEIIKEVKER